MLNELKEFEAYVTNPTSSTPRVMPKMLTDHFSEKDEYLIGIEEIMTVIARRYLFSEAHQVYDQDGKLNKKVIEDAIELLHRWTGFSLTEDRKRTENPENPDLEKWMKEHCVEAGWLKIYWTYHFQEFIKNKEEEKKLAEVTEEREKKLAEITEKRWNKLEKKWNSRFNSPMDYAAVRITYKNVIANALEMGPLRNRYLVVKRSDEQDGKKFRKSDKKPFRYLTDKSSRKGTSDTKIIKVIATYLINKENHPANQNEIWIKSADLSRWYAQDDTNNGAESWYPKNVTWNGENVYFFKRLQKKYTKVIINQEYMKAYDFNIIEPKEEEKYQGKYWILEDCGHGLENCWNIK